MQSDKINIHQNSYNGIWIEMKVPLFEIDYDHDFVPAIECIVNCNYSYFTKRNKAIIDAYPSYLNKSKDAQDLSLLFNCKNLFNQLKDFVVTDTNEITLKLNAQERCAVYLLCKFFNLECERYKEFIPVLIPCTDFLPANKGKPRDQHKIYSCIHDDNYVYGFRLECGCDYAPGWFLKHREYTDDRGITYSKRLTKRTTGIKLILDKNMYKKTVLQKYWILHVNTFSKYIQWLCRDLFIELLNDFL